MNISWILIGIVGIVVVWAIWAYNRFVRLTNQTEEAWSDIDVQLKRRYDLIPNLVETVKGYAAHEAGTLQISQKTRKLHLLAAWVGGWVRWIEALGP